MDIIGKLYQDYFIEDFKLDGTSNLLEDFSIGGAYNILKDDLFINNINFEYCANFFLICNEILESKLSNLNFAHDIVMVKTEDELPSAFIIEKHAKRSSYLINDDIIKVKKFKAKSRAACIFYGDKINLDSMNHYSKLYIDTAGNNLNHLFELAKIYKLSDKSIISISSEYLTQELIKEFIFNSGFTVIAHSPEETSIFTNKGESKIQNKSYLPMSSLKNKYRITGLGDKYFYIFSLYNYYLNLPIEECIILSQKYIGDYILKITNR